MKIDLKISIITPTYNSEKYLEECITSIISQNYSNYEHIIIDGKSTDRTLEIIRKYEGLYPVKWISEKDGGMYDAIQKGFSMASGDVYAWLNSDDLYFPWTFEVVGKIFREKKNINWLIGQPCNRVSFNGAEINCSLPNLPSVFCTKFIQKGYYNGKILPFIQQESCFWRKNLWQQAGRNIGSRYKLAGDYFLWKKFSQYADLYSVHCNLACFRIHEDQLSKNIELYYDEINGRKIGRFKPQIMMVLAHLYSLSHYRKKMINLNELYHKEAL